MKKICSVEGCDGVLVAKGLCNMHYLRLKNSGKVGSSRRYVEPRRSGYIRKDGYRIHSVGEEKKLEHVMVAEKALGRALRGEEIVHHADENRTNNAPSNLVICPGNGYHQLLHRRMRAMDSCGNPNYRKCRYCKQYSDPANMSVIGREAYHKYCQAEWHRNWRKNRQARPASGAGVNGLIG